MAFLKYFSVLLQGQRISAVFITTRSQTINHASLKMAMRWAYGRKIRFPQEKEFIMDRVGTFALQWANNKTKGSEQHSKDRLRSPIPKRGGALVLRNIIV